MTATHVDHEFGDLNDLRKFVMHVVRRHGFNREDQEDFAQETLVRLITHRGQYDMVDQPKNITVRIVLNLIIDHRRLLKNRFTRAEEKELLTLTTSDNPFESTFAHQIFDYIATMPQKQKDALTFEAMGHHTVDESRSGKQKKIVNDETIGNQNNFYSSLFRGRKKLKELL